MKKLLLSLLFLSAAPAWSYTTVTTANAYMVENTTGVTPSGNACYEVSTNPGCSAYFNGLTLSTSTVFPPGSTNYIQNSLTPTTTSQVFKVLTGNTTNATNVNVTISSTMVMNIGNNGTATGSNALIASHSTPYIRLTNPALISVAKIDTSGVVGGHTVLLDNATGNPITIINNIDSSGQQIVTGTNANLLLPTNALIYLIYDNNSNHWNTVDGAAAGITFSTNTWTGGNSFSSMTLTGPLIAGTTSGIPAQVLVSTGTSLAPTVKWAFQGIVQSSVCAIVGISSSTTSSSYVTTNLSCTITPKGTGNSIRVSFSGDLQNANGVGNNTFLTIAKNGTNALSVNGCTSMFTNVATTIRNPVSCLWQDQGATTIGVPITYAVQIKSSDNTTVSAFPSGNVPTASMFLDEIGPP